MAEDKPTGGGFNLLWALIIGVVLLSLWVQNGGVQRGKNSSPFKIASNNSTISKSSNPKTNSNPSNGGETSTDNESQYKGLVKINRGNSGSEIQPYKEYITLQAGSSNKKAINISGWTLKNGQDEKGLDVYGREVQGQASYVKIPEKGVVLYNPYQPNNNAPGPIILSPGDKAVILTGKMGNISPVTIRDNFKVNKCMAYVENLDNYNFIPTLSTKCPNDKDLPAVGGLSDECYNFVRSMPNCTQIIFKWNDKIGNYCYGTNNSRCPKISQQCRDFVANNFNFEACWNRHKNEPDFVGKEWRIFLNQTWSLWGSRRDSISLFDKNGLLVDKISY